MPIVHQFIGSATLYSDDEKFKKKDVSPIRFQARFDAAGWRVRAADFEPVEIKDVEAGGYKFKLVVSLDESATGSFDAAQGRLSIRALFKFKPVLPLVPSSMLDITLDGGSHVLNADAVVAGKPYDPQTGALSLAGIGSFISGTMKGARCAIQLDGVFSPLL